MSIIIILCFPSSALSGSVVCVFTHLAVVHRLMVVMMMMVVCYSPEYVHARVRLGEIITELQSYTRARGGSALLFYFTGASRAFTERWNEDERLKDGMFYSRD